MLVNVLWLGTLQLVLPALYHHEERVVCASCTGAAMAFWQTRCSGPDVMMILRSSPGRVKVWRGRTLHHGPYISMTAMYIARGA